MPPAHKVSLPVPPVCADRNKLEKQTMNARKEDRTLIVLAIEAV